MNEFRLKRNRANVRGVLHADEVSYYFKHNFGPIPDRQSMEFTAIRRFVGHATEKRTDFLLQNFFLIHLDISNDFIRNDRQPKR